MFEDATAFNQDLSRWNIDAVTNMASIFKGATAFTQTLCWDISGKTITSMFTSSGGSIGEALTDANFQTACDAWVSDSTTATDTYCTIQFWDTSDITDMSNAFENAVSFNDDISAWDVSSATNMANTFANAAAFDQDISAWVTSSVARMDYVSNKSMSCCWSDFSPVFAS
jgi:surface protein